ncbi:hypothetical protein HPO96_29780 [Kribbella sandramycini]|uniref:Uncharacterized protein n=1 Tax=Kribbella sandramycini TaxID=60450 RepID=A0A7Y4L4W8_9ACTN|nr:hypothetical protein [Kribbella sandramycini]MBB6571803.1 hypothetical protein [Kribbella sandramycini]NOL44445.1 hypothetical protein [Kribbella sandramycini]
MTATTVALPRGITNLDRLRQVLRAMRIGSMPMLSVYWGVMLILFLAGGFVVQALNDGTGNSIWDYGTQSPKYFSMAAGISLAPAYLNLLVAQGVTRRMFSVAAGIFLALAATTTALLWVLGYQVERVVYDAQGWGQSLENAHLFSSTSQAGLIFVEFFLLIVSHEATGWLLGVTFYRFGFWRGLVLIPLSLLPAAATEFLLVSQWLAGPLSGVYERPPLAIAVPAVLVVTALGLYAGHRVLRPMPLKPAKG